MWKCKKCSESIEGSFDVCWNCGTSKDGVEDPTFQRAEDAGAGDVAERLPEGTIQTSETARPAPAVAGRCAHCGGVELIRGVRLGLTAETGSVGLKHQTLLVFVGTEPLLADVCKGCGSVARLYVRETDLKWIVE